jgi:hypothetical protein
MADLTVRVTLGQRAMRAGAGVVDNQIGLAEMSIYSLEQPGHASRVCRVCCHGKRSCFGGQLRQFFDIAGSEGNFSSGRAHHAGQRSADAGTGADDERRAIGNIGHGLPFM